jgi:hypothetical protein
MAIAPEKMHMSVKVLRHVVTLKRELTNEGGKTSLLASLFLGIGRENALGH